jgi:hypothetical protein
MFWLFITCLWYDLLIILYIIKVVLDCQITYILLIIENTTGMSHLKTNRTGFVILFYLTEANSAYETSHLCFLRLRQYPM